MKLKTDKEAHDRRFKRALIAYEGSSVAYHDVLIEALRLADSQLETEKAENL